MLTLLTYPAGFGQFSLSPFCVKAAYLLKASGLLWQREDISDPRRMPMQKLPVLRTPERLVADTAQIQTYLADQGAVFDARLGDLDKARALTLTLTRMAEEHLYFHLVLDRWGDDTVWPTIREIYFKEIPAVLRRPVSNSLRRAVLRGLKVQGLTRFSPQDRLDRATRDLGAIATHLWHGPFLLGDQPTSADFSVAPVLAALRATPVQTALGQRVDEDLQLTDYLDRMDTALLLP